MITAGGGLPQWVEGQVEPGKVEVAPYKLRLEERDGKCVLHYTGPREGEISLGVQPPCEFVRVRDGGAQRYRYKNRKRNGGGYFDVVMVIGGPLDKSRSDMLMKDGCGTHNQAVSLSRRGVVAGAVGSGIISCPSTPLDEKDFGFLAKPI